MTDKLQRAKVILALAQFRDETEAKLQSVLEPYREWIKTPCDRCGEIKMYMDKLTADIRAIDNKLEELL